MLAAGICPPPSFRPPCVASDKTMTQTQLNNPLHGITLERLLNELVAHYGWDGLGQRIDIRCFTHEPSIASSLKFLRRTPWARQHVEALYLEMSGRQG
jgi:uncharacterized protein (DUF2132 family)